MKPRRLGRGPRPKVWTATVAIMASVGVMLSGCISGPDDDVEADPSQADALEQGPPPGGEVESSLGNASGGTQGLWASGVVASYQTNDGARLEVRLSSPFQSKDPWGSPVEVVAAIASLNPPNGSQEYTLMELVSIGTGRVVSHAGSCAIVDRCDKDRWQVTYAAFGWPAIFVQDSLASNFTVPGFAGTAHHVQTISVSSKHGSAECTTMSYGPADGPLAHAAAFSTIGGHTIWCPGQSVPSEFRSDLGFPYPLEMSRDSVWQLVEADDGKAEPISVGGAVAMLGLTPDAQRLDWAVAFAGDQEPPSAYPTSIAHQDAAGLSERYGHLAAMDGAWIARSGIVPGGNSSSLLHGDTQRDQRSLAVAVPGEGVYQITIEQTNSTPSLPGFSPNRSVEILSEGFWPGDAAPAPNRTQDLVDPPWAIGHVSDLVMREPASGIVIWTALRVGNSWGNGAFYTRGDSYDVLVRLDENESEVDRAGSLVIRRPYLSRVDGLTGGVIDLHVPGDRLEAVVGKIPAG